MTNQDPFNQNEIEKQTIFKEENLIATDAETKTSIGLEAKMAATIAHIPIIGLIFFFMEKENRFVRFHALQVVIFSLALFVVGIAMSIFTGVLSLIKLGWLGWLAGGAFYVLITPISFILLIYMAVQAYQGKVFKLPIIGKFAEEHAQPK